MPPPPPGSTAAPLKRATEKGIRHRDGHVVYGSSQFRAGIRAPAVGKVDEIHNLNLATQAGAEASDQLKYLSERIPATFVLAGIDVAASGLFNGVRGQQIAGRYTVSDTEPFAYGTSAQRQSWRKLVASLEDALQLHRHKPGSLVKLDGYLHERTDGAIGSLSQLVRGASIEAIISGSESITRNTLDSIEVDQTAESARVERRRARRPRRRGPDADAA